MTYLQYSTLRLFGRTEPEKAAIMSGDSDMASDMGLTERQLIAVLTAHTVKAALITLGLTQQAAAVKTGVPIDTISAWCAADGSERKRVPPRYMVDLLIYALVT